MSPRAKVQANGPLRKSADTTWKTPEWLLERVRIFFGGPIPFDPATALDNPTKALRYCAGPPGRLFSTSDALRCENCQKHLDTGMPALIPATCERCNMARQNGLDVSWDWPWWVNPPFTKEWIQKIGREASRSPTDFGPGARAGLALLPANRFEEPYLQDVLVRASAICFVDAKSFQLDLKRAGHRIAFVSSIDNQPVEANPYASMILLFNGKRSSFEDAFACPEKPMGSSFMLQPIGSRAAT